MSNKQQFITNTKWLLISSCLLAFFLVFRIDLKAQTIKTKYWVELTDKNNTPFTVGNPSAFLSSRSVARRAKFNIPVTTTDLPVDPAYTDSISKVPNIKIINRSRWFNAVTVELTDTTDTVAIPFIQNLSFVKNTQPVNRYKRHIGIEGEVKEVISQNRVWDEKISSFNYGASYNQINMIGGVCLHNQGYRGQGMLIAVLDAGFADADTSPIFDSLRAENRILATWDFVEHDTNVYDAHKHGTMVLSTMAGNVPGSIIGTAPKAEYILLKTEDGATEFIIEEDNWVSGAEFADSCGTDILTTSLQYTEFDDSTQNHTYAQMDGNTARITIANDLAAEKGMFVVASAGNQGGSPWNFIGAPADGDSVLAVGSVDSMRNYSWFSSNGPTADGRVKPNVACQGQDAVVANPDTAGIAWLSGTSFAGPITAGMVACLWQANPTNTNMEVFNAIQQTASQASNPDTLLGYGISDFCAADFILGMNSSTNADFSLTVFPNPFSHEVSVGVEGISYGKAEIRVYDAMGNKVLMQEVDYPVTKLNMKNASIGVYTVQLEVFEGKSKGIYQAKALRF